MNEISNKNENSSRESSYSASPLKLLLIIAASIFIVEGAIMIILHRYIHIDPKLEMAIDVLFLTAALFPVLYFFLFRPMILHKTAHRDSSEAHRASEAQVRLLLDSTAEGIYGLDLNGNCTFANQACIEMLGYDGIDDLIGNHMHDLIHHTHEDGKSNPLEECSIYQAFRSGKGTNVDNEVFWHKDGTSFPVEYWCYPIERGEECIGSVVTFLDITGRKRAEEAFRVNETKYRLIHNAAFDGIIIADSNSSIIECNKSAEEIFGYEDKELVGMKISELMPEKFRKPHLKGVSWFCETGDSEIQGTIIELQGLRKDGEVFPIELVLSGFKLNDKMFISGTIRDITERKNSEASIERLAYHDHLTGLPNRLLFKDRIDQALLREVWHNRNIAVLFLDLNRFKIINDTFGHAFGDDLLKVVASRLQDCLREGDTVARLGGDEFTILLQDLAKADDISLVIEKVLHAVKQPIAINNEEVVVGSSIGVSVFPDDGQDSDTLLKNADIAMYRAKSEGNNNFQMYTPAMSTKAFGILKMEHRLNRALDKGDFALHYQPEIDLRTGKIVGMEALVRLADSPDGTLTYPGEFIQIAEETGTIIPLSEWVLRMACEHNKSYQDAGYSPIRVAVNISPKVFKQKNFIKTVVDILSGTGLEPKYLEIEITEETLMIDANDTVKTMNTLKDLGVRFAIDDFGTGYSSLSYIKMLPIEQLKIDRAFIKDLSTSSDDKAIVTAIIKMAHSMKIEVIAEGVETEEQLEFLNSLGCDRIQGYLFSRPVSYVRFEELLQQPPDITKYRTDALKTA